jgi:hypothetical protein
MYAFFIATSVGVVVVGGAIRRHYKPWVRRVRNLFRRGGREEGKDVIAAEGCAMLTMILGAEVDNTTAV